ncbi:MAG TPA: TPM domain-containing protein, partial [Stellaceae bacterium]|nr:TPM domain-containing protein [Stellaceae bacterium]
LRLRQIAPARALAFLLLALWATAAAAAEPQFPPLTGRVVDDAHVLSPATKSALDEMLARHEQATGEQVVVVTLKSLGGTNIEDYGYQLGRHWGIGEKGKNTGALLIVAPNDRQVRIEVGYGLEGKLTDAQSRVIIERDILPAFRRGDLNAGVIAGATSMLRVLGGDAAAPASGIARKVTGAQGIDSGLEIILILAVWIFIFVMFRRTRPRGPMGALPWVLMGSGFRSGGLPPGGGGFGGFSGGGGSFGGGGASGRW